MSYPYPAIPVQESPAKSPIQLSLLDASRQMNEINLDYLSAKQAEKSLMKNLKSELEDDPEYRNVIEEEKRIKKIKLDLREQSADLKQRKELLMKNLDSYAEVEDFIEKKNEEFHTRKTKVLVSLEQDLKLSGLQAEASYKAGKNPELSLIVARS